MNYSIFFTHLLQEDLSYNLVVQPIYIGHSLSQAVRFYPSPNLLNYSFTRQDITNSFDFSINNPALYETDIAEVNVLTGQNYVGATHSNRPDFILGQRSLFSISSNSNILYADASKEISDDSISVEEYSLTFSLPPLESTDISYLFNNQTVKYKLPNVTPITNFLFSSIPIEEYNYVYQDITVDNLTTTLSELEGYITEGEIEIKTLSEAFEVTDLAVSESFGEVICPDNSLIKFYIPAIGRGYLPSSDITNSFIDNKVAVFDIALAIFTLDINNYYLSSLLTELVYKSKLYKTENYPCIPSSIPRINLPQLPAEEIILSYDLAFLGLSLLEYIHKTQDTFVKNNSEFINDIFSIITDIKNTLISLISFDGYIFSSRTSLYINEDIDIAATILTCIFFDELNSINYEFIIERHLYILNSNIIKRLQSGFNDFIETNAISELTIFCKYYDLNLYLNRCLTNLNDSVLARYLLSNLTQQNFIVSVHNTLNVCIDNNGIPNYQLTLFKLLSEQSKFFITKTTKNNRSFESTKLFGSVARDIAINLLPIGKTWFKEEVEQGTNSEVYNFLNSISSVLELLQLQINYEIDSKYPLTARGASLRSWLRLLNIQFNKFASDQWVTNLIESVITNNTLIINDDIQTDFSFNSEQSYFLLLQSITQPTYTPFPISITTIHDFLKRYFIPLSTQISTIELLNIDKYILAEAALVTLLNGKYVPVLWKDYLATGHIFLQPNGLLEISLIGKRLALGYNYIYWNKLETTLKV